VQGSFAVGDCDRDSDVDWIVAVRGELSDDQVGLLQAAHERIYCLPCPWAQHLEGSYFPLAVLRDAEQSGKPLWYLDHGSRALVRSDHCNTLVVRSVVRAQGVVLAGPPPATLVDPITVAALRQEIRTTMRTFGLEILEHQDRYRNRFYQGYIVLNYCRMLHDLTVGYPGSKRAGAAWAKATLDGSWSPLIDRAWGGRPDPAAAVREPADLEEFDRTLQFLALTIRESERV
jgi:hypothetical protein